MKFKFLSLVIACILATPILLADPTEEEIPLYEVVNAGFIDGDNPLDDSLGDEITPPRPTSFHATIAGRTLSVMTDVTSSTRVIVRNSTGTQVVNRLFVGGTTEQLETGSYSIEIQSGSLTLVGQFSAH